MIKEIHINYLITRDDYIILLKHSYQKYLYDLNSISFVHLGNEHFLTFQTNVETGVYYRILFHKKVYQKSSL